MCIRDSFLTIIAYAGTIPPWDKPNIKDTMNSDNWLSNGKKKTKDNICNNDPIKMVYIGPILSDKNPKPILLIIPDNSITDKIWAPTVRPKPLSTHKATIWTWGIAIARQQPIPANTNKICKVLGERFLIVLFSLFKLISWLFEVTILFFNINEIGKMITKQIIAM